MKEKDREEDHEIEDILKKRMDELSDSVDRFSRISERVFPENDADFFDSDYVVTDLENITGRHRAAPLLKLAAAVSAAIFIVAVLPKTALFSRLLCALTKQDSELYRSLVNEISAISENTEDIRIYDIAIEDYIKKDVLVTPLYSCPFEAPERDNVRVRVFVKTYNDILTNQMYAVEYSGEYRESNFIAAADTDVTFTDEQLEKACDDINNLLTFDMPYKGYHVDEGLALSFMHYSIFSDQQNVFSVRNMVTYQCDTPERYRYDLLSETILDGEIKENRIVPYTAEWKHSVYYDGSSAYPKKSGSVFEKTQLITSEESEDRSTYLEFYPYENIENKNVYSDLENITVYGMSADIPADISDLRSLSMRLYGKSSLFFHASSQSDPKIEIKCTDSALNRSIGKDELTHSIFDQDDTIINTEKYKRK